MQQLPPNLTQPARYVLEMAREITPTGAATQTEHILYALLQIPGSDATQILDGLGANSQQLLETVRASLRSTVQVDGAIAWSAAAAQVIGQASTMAFQQRGKEISTRHLLTALLSVENPVRSLLFDRGISLNKLEDAPEKKQVPPAKVNPNRAPTVRHAAIQVSAVFWGILAATLFCGYLVWTPAVPNKAFAVLLFVFMGWIVSLCLHEFGHAFAAYLFGDDSVIDRGYLTLNPLRYTHPVFSIVVPLVFLLLGGIGLPGGAVYIDRSRISPGWRHSVVAAAGPLATAGCAIMLWLVYILVPDELKTAHEAFFGGLSFLLFLEVMAFVLNLTPLPPLDGFNILEPFFPPFLQRIAMIMRQWSMFIFMLLFWYDNPVKDGIFQVIYTIILGLRIHPYWLSLGSDLFFELIPRIM